MSHLAHAMHPVEAVLLALGAYLGVGLGFALLFVLCGGPARIDPAAKGAGWGFRLVILPGAALFWPYLLVRWVRRLPPPAERGRHRPNS